MVQSDEWLLILLQASDGNIKISVIFNEISVKIG